MTANEAAIRRAYQVAEDKDIAGWVNCFTEKGTFTDGNSSGGLVLFVLILYALVNDAMAKEAMAIGRTLARRT